MTIDGDAPRMVTLPLKPMVVEPVTLEGQYIRMEPLSADHYAGLCEALVDEDLWRWIFVPVKTADDMQRFIETALKLRDEGSILPFVTVYKPENRVVGTSRFLSIDTTHHAIEIGTTVVGKKWQRTVVNTEAKYLMLRHAFETLGCLRVQLQTDSLNTQSRNAILRLGAKQEGIVRNHRVYPNGRLRNTVYFSIMDQEWPAVKADLEAKIARPFTPSASKG